MRVCDALKMGCHTWVMLCEHGLLYFTTHMYMSGVWACFHICLPGV